MGVPAFFRWLSRKYTSLVLHCVEEKPKTVDGINIPVDSSKPNPNDVEFDNLYLDMNGIIHPCCHPENKPAPKNEEEMMVLIFEYIDRIFAICRPRRLLYMAIDGVAPRAKMNQQRSRRFRAAKESIEKREEIAKMKEELRSKGLIVPPDKPPSEHFDSNCITPGTPFMFRLADCLRYYIHDRLNNDPGWQGIGVILSDANVPGEGEHKIMDFIRKQRAQPDHDPNTQHCLCGADADLIMLGLATHEPHFTIIREEFKPNEPKPCELCAQFGHELKECQGLPKEKSAENDPKQMGADCEFIFIRLPVLREFLTKELETPNLPFKQDIERAIDDWVFMCFFVGNDFLPHLPSLEIREGAIDRLIKLYKQTIHKTGGYLTENGFVSLERTQMILRDLGEVEDEIFKQRRESDVNFRRKNKMRRRRERGFKNAKRPSFQLGGQYTPQAASAGSAPITNPRQTAYQMRMQSNQMHGGRDAAAGLKAMMHKGNDGDNRRGEKRKSTDAGDSDSEPEPDDDVKLWEDGWKDRYYQNKFGLGENDVAFRYEVGRAYVLGLAWVLQYYYQGCASWKWYFPYHYAPFASDFINIGDVDIKFPKDTAPIKPMEQLMSVFPAASRAHVPDIWGELMFKPDSPIIDFYPTDFKIDLNGKKFAWQGVALLPFVDKKRLDDSLVSVYDKLSPSEQKRNVRGPDRLFVGKNHPSYAFLEGLYEQNGVDTPTGMNTEYTKGMACEVWSDPLVSLPGETYSSPLKSCRDLIGSSAIVVRYRDPQYAKEFVFPACLLPGAKLPPPTVKPEDWGEKNPGQRYKPQLGFQRGSHYRGQGQRSPATAARHIRGALGGGMSSGSGQYSNVPPLLGSGGGGGGGGGGRQHGSGGGGNRDYRDNRGRGGGSGSGGYQDRRDNRQSGSGYGGGYGGASGGASSGSYGGGGGGYNSYRSTQSSGSSSYGGASAWNRNLSGQQNAYSQNQQRNYSGGTGSYGGSGGGSSYGVQQGSASYRSYQGGGGGGGARSGASYGGIESYSTSRGTNRPSSGSSHSSSQGYGQGQQRNSGGYQQNRRY